MLQFYNLICLLLNFLSSIIPYVVFYVIKYLFTMGQFSFLFESIIHVPIYCI